MRTIVALFAALAVTTATAQTPSPAAPQPQPAAQTPAQPSGTRPLPQAKTKDEHDAYEAAMRKPTPAEEEAAAREFEQKFPQSELRAVLYQDLLLKYQAANNADKALEMGRKVVQVDPDHVVALVLTANILAETTRATDLDRDQKYAEGTKYAQHALAKVDTGLAVPPNAPPEKVKEWQALAKSMAHTALGWIELKRDNLAAAVTHLRLATELNKAQPDAVVYLRLALALDRQQKYQEALAAANRALELAGSGAVADAARQERDRLTKLLGSAPPAPAAKPTPTPTPTPAPSPSQPPRG